MVKPPKTMQPEGVDLSKAGRKPGRSSFQQQKQGKNGSGGGGGDNDIFHKYMARKIDLQRKQFGLVLPPPPSPSPPPSTNVNTNATSTTNTNNRNDHIQETKLQSNTKRKRKHSPPSISYSSFVAASASTSKLARTTKTTPLHREEEEEEENKDENDELASSKSKNNNSSSSSNNKQIENQRNSLSRTSTSKSTKGEDTTKNSLSIGSILQRLQQRHGFGNRNLYRKKRCRNEISVLPELDDRKCQSTTTTTTRDTTTRDTTSLDDNNNDSHRYSEKNSSQQLPLPIQQEPEDNDDTYFSNNNEGDNNNDKEDENYKTHSSRNGVFDRSRKIDHHHSEITKESLLIPTLSPHDETALSVATMSTTTTNTPQTPSLSNMKQINNITKQSRPDLFFLGIVIKVAGFTDPDNETLKRLLQKHGGDYETYETVRVTHIIAQQLSKAKADIYKRQKKPRPVCTPLWILDCVKQRKLLPHGPYLLPQLKLNNNHGMSGSNGCCAQRGIDAMFGHAATTTTVAGTATAAATTTTTIARKNDFATTTTTTTASTATKQPNYSNRDKINPYSHKLLHNEKELDSRLIGTSKHRDHHQNDVSKVPESISILEQNDTLLDSLPELTLDDSLKTKANETKAPFDFQEDKEVQHERGQEQEESANDDSHVLPIKNAPLHHHHQSNPKNVQEEGEEKVESSKSTFKPRSIGGAGAGKTDDKYINGKIRTVGTDPNFLDTFFSSSRLSFIGSYRQRAQTAGTVNVGNFKSSSALLNLDNHGGDEARQQVSKHASCATKRYVFHIDMDSFFASVVLRNYPQYKDKPVAISHNGKGREERGNNSNNNNKLPSVTPKNSTSECATCNYKAREYGIKKGMFLGRAKQLCPDLIVLYYDFDGYEEVAEQVLEILHGVSTEYNGIVEAVSCDEAYMELALPITTNNNNNDADTIAFEIAEKIRINIFETTQCTASIGVAQNKFLAKIGTDRVKPNGSYVVSNYKDVLKDLKLRDLHGIGYRSEPKLTKEGLIHVQDVWDCGDNAEMLLSRILGPGLGKKIFDFCHGKDNRPVQASAERKTIGAECNYGVRFDGPYGIDHFMLGLATEVQKRMEGVGVFGSRVTLKLKKRKEGAKPPPKFLGHGSCYNLSKSRNIPNSIGMTRDAKAIYNVGMALFQELSVPLDDVRGMGIIMSKLDTHDNQHNNNKDSYNCGNNGRISDWFASTTNNHAATGMCNDNLKERGDEIPADVGDESLLTREGHSTTVPSLLNNDDNDNNNMSKFDQIVVDGQSIEDNDEKSLQGEENSFKNDDCHRQKLGDNKEVQNNDEESMIDLQKDEYMNDWDKNNERNNTEETNEQFDDHISTNNNDDTDNDDNPVPSFMDVDLPPISQIRMSQVDALPDDLKNTIRSKIKRIINEGERGNNQPKDQRQPVEFPNGNENVFFQENHPIYDVTRGENGNAFDDVVVLEEPFHPNYHFDDTGFIPQQQQQQRPAALFAGNNYYNNYNNNNNNNSNNTTSCSGKFRQMDLKRLMKLAAVKSGKVDTDIALSQLDHLPLEIKLQVVNQDTAPVGAAAASSVMIRRRSRGGRGGRVVTQSRGRVSSNRHKSTAIRRNITKKAPSKAAHNTTNNNIPMRPRPLERPKNVYQEDIVPLKQFMDENTATDKEALEKVQEFLLICIREGRLDDMTTIIRSICNRNDGWSTTDTLKVFADALDQEHFRINSTRLDIEWIFGNKKF